MADPEGVTVIERPDLDAPALLVMLNGWIDASGAAAAAIGLIQNESGARTIATFDPDLFIDYRARRPVMELRDGVATRLVWPSIELKAGRDIAGRDVLVLSGYEPDSNWRRFADLATDLALGMGARIMIGLGAYPFATPHTRPSRLSCTTPSAEMARSVSYLRNSVDVPAGVAAVLEQSFHDKGVPAIGLWVQVPHYIATMAFPAASAALIDGVNETAGVTFEAHGPRHEAVVQRQRLDQLVAANPEHVTMVEQLERAYDSLDDQTIQATPAPPPFELGDLPSGDELAAELEQFLRDQGS